MTTLLLNTDRDNELYSRGPKLEDSFAHLDTPPGDCPSCDPDTDYPGALCPAHEQQAMDEAEEWRGEGCCE